MNFLRIPKSPNIQYLEIHLTEHNSNFGRKLQNREILKKNSMEKSSMFMVWTMQYYEMFFSQFSSV